MKMSPEYGPVVIEGFFAEPRICYYDDDDSNELGEECAVIYLGDIFLSSGYLTVPHHCLRAVTTDDLWTRREVIHKLISPIRNKASPQAKKLPLKERYRLLVELAYIDGVLMDRLFVARTTETKKKHKVFISHASADKQFARWLATDLANAGHRPWLDEWEISAGQSIPTAIGVGIDCSDFVLLILSKISTKSHWVEREWQAKYWDEVQKDKVLIIPVLIEDCEIPVLLRTKKYADFRHQYSDGFEEVVAALAKLKPKSVKKKA